ncbi:unnamed protein product [Lymnaea stagnalis]|uniref:Ubiquitin-related modifier 1 homolog n=1 Tax=Lymnaea stagnalis TaxID=6523 RepID=A0AAV2I1V4_LYMST
MTLRITVEFSGGAELLCRNVKKHSLTLPKKEETWLIRNLLKWLQENIIKERPELFIQGDTVRPGILVLINDADWELMGELDYEIQENDRVIFISTLHGG